MQFKSIQKRHKQNHGGTIGIASSTNVAYCTGPIYNIVWRSTKHTNMQRQTRGNCTFWFKRRYAKATVSHMFQTPHHGTRTHFKRPRLECAFCLQIPVSQQPLGLLRSRKYFVREYETIKSEPCAWHHMLLRTSPPYSLVVPSRTGGICVCNKSSSPRAAHVWIAHILIHFLIGVTHSNRSPYLSALMHQPYPVAYVNQI